MTYTNPRPAVALACLMAAILTAGCGAVSGATAGRDAASTTPPSTTTSPPASGASTATTGLPATSPGPYGATCRTAQLRLSPGGRVSEATEQNTLLLVLRNDSPTGCDLRGYARVSLLDAAGSALPFRYRRTGDQMLTSARPTVVPLAPGASAYLGINKNTCETGGTIASSTIRLTPPGASQPLTLTLSSLFQGRLGYCGAGNPGHTVDISPVEPTTAAVFASH